MRKAEMVQENFGLSTTQSHCANRQWMPSFPRPLSIDSENFSWCDSNLPKYNETMTHRAFTRIEVVDMTVFQIRNYELQRLKKLLDRWFYAGDYYRLTMRRHFLSYLKMIDCWRYFALWKTPEYCENWHLRLIRWLLIRCTTRGVSTTWSERITSAWVSTKIFWKFRLLSNPG